MYPFEFELLWRLHHDGPQTAGEILELMPLRRREQNRPQDIGTRLASMRRRELVERTDDGVWWLTSWGSRVATA